MASCGLVGSYPLHTFASHHFDATKSLLLVKDTLGHRSIATTDKYVHRLNNSPSGTTDCLMDGASFLNGQASVVSLFGR